MRSDAATVAEYLDEIPTHQIDIVRELRELVLNNLPDGYYETMNWGMITYEVPLEASGKTYNGKPLMYVAIGAQKNHVGLYLCGIYCRANLKNEFAEAYEKAGLKLDMGRACIRIRKPEHILREAVIDAVRALSMEEYIEICRR